MKLPFLVLLVSVFWCLSAQAALVILPSATATSMGVWTNAFLSRSGLDGVHVGTYAPASSLIAQTIHAGDTVQFSLLAGPGQSFLLKRGFTFLQAEFSFGSSNNPSTSDLSLFLEFAGGSGNAGPTKLESGAIAAHLSAIITFFGAAETFQFNEFRFTWTAATTVEVGALPFSGVSVYTDTQFSTVPYLTLVPEPNVSCCLLLCLTGAAVRRRRS